MKRILISMAMLLPGLTVPAKVISPEEAISRVQSSNFRKIQLQSGLRLTQVIEAESGPVAYIFNKEGGGFLILSADSEAEAILGFAEYGSIDADDMPCCLTAWLDFYKNRIEGIRLDGNVKTRKKENEDYKERPELPIAVATKWGQQEPFNNRCPLIGDRPCVTGCVATALAQLLNLYRYSTHGVGIHSYEWGYRDKDGAYDFLLSLDFDALDFDWDNMKNDYSEAYSAAEGAAVAELMYACGVAVDMNYGTSASGIPAQFVPYGLWQYLGFNPGIRCVERDTYSYKECSWDDFVYDQIREHGAVVYTGVTSSNEGHAFVCDGYLGDGLFHINWGWNGISDGWFRLDALGPQVQGTGGSATSKAFNLNQNILAFVDPDAEGEEFLPSIFGRDDAFNVTNKTIEKGSKFTVVGSLLNSTQLDYELDFGCLLTDSESGTEGEVIQVAHYSMPSCSMEKIFAKTVFPEYIPDGKYCMRPVVHLEGRAGWWALPWNARKPNVWIEIAEGKVMFNVDPTLMVASILEESTRNERYINTSGLSTTSHGKGVSIKIGKGSVEKIIH